ncbi:MAG: hypothetical protein QM651_10535 [Rhodoblastus sp.]
MKIRGLLSVGVALAVFAASAVESYAFVGGAGSAPAFGIGAGADLSGDIHEVRAGAGARRGGATARRGGNVNVKRGANVNVKRGANVNVRGGNTVVVRRPVRVWSPRPYYGTVVAGVALGTVIAVSVAATAPRPPASNLCWFWSDSAQMNGYWDYCVPPR